MISSQYNKHSIPIMTLVLKYHYSLDIEIVILLDFVIVILLDILIAISLDIVTEISLDIAIIYISIAI